MHSPLSKLLLWGTICFFWLTTVAHAVPTFGSPELYDIGSDQTSLAAGDFDQDGWLDLAIASGTGLLVMMNNGDGTFSEPIRFYDGNQILSVIVGDIDNDGDLDLIAHGHVSGRMRLLILTNVGGGSLQESAYYEGPTWVRQLLCLDLDGDQYLDIVAADNSGIGGLAIFWNDRSGGFANIAYHPEIEGPVAVTAGDFNGDTRIDLAALPGLSDQLAILTNLGNRQFETTTKTIGENATGIETADINNDRYPDLVISFGIYIVEHQVAVLLNNGLGSLCDPVEYDAGVGPYSIGAADLDWDGDPDVFAAGKSEEAVVLLEDSPDGTLAAPTMIPSGNIPFYTIVADIDNDGRGDLITAGYLDSPLSVVRNNSLEGYGLLTGIVYDPTGGGGVVSGALVEYMRFGKVYHTYSTDYQGLYDETYRIEAGLWTVRVSRPGYRTLIADWVIEIGSNFAWVHEIYPESYPVADIEITGFLFRDSSFNQFANRLDLPVEVNNRGDIAYDLQARVYIDGEAIPLSLGDRERRDTGLIRSINPGIDTIKLAEVNLDQTSWENHQVEVKLIRANDLPMEAVHSSELSCYWAAKPSTDPPEPFDIRQDAYSFKNFSAKDSDIRDRLIESCPLLNSVFDLLRQILIDLSDDGLCWGFAGSTYSYFKNSGWKPFQSETFAMGKNDYNVISYLMAYHVTQTASSYFHPGNGLPTEEAAKCREIILSDGPALLYFRSQEGNHAVNCFKMIEKEDSDSIFAYIYDSNDPSDPEILDDRRIRVAYFDLSTATGEVSYEFAYINADGIYHIDSYSGIRAFQPIEFNGDVCSLIGFVFDAIGNLIGSAFGDGFQLLSFDCPVRAMATDLYGNRTGFVTADSTINEIPGARLTYQEQDSVNVDIQFQLPNDEPFDVEIWALDTGLVTCQSLKPVSDSTAIFQLFDSIPLESSSRLTLTLVPAEYDSLEIDFDGNGTLDKTVYAKNNLPPRAPIIVSPTEGESIEGPVTFVWTRSHDFDPGDDVSYRVVLSQDVSFLSTDSSEVLLDTAYAWSEELDVDTVYYFKVLAIDSRGAVSELGQTQSFSIKSPTAVEDESDDLPVSYNLSQNYPNPFNPSTSIEFDLPRRSNVKISVYNLLGQEVSQLVDQEFSAGNHRIYWDGSTDSGQRASTGVYFYRIEAEGYVETKKMLLLK